MDFYQNLLVQFLEQVSGKQGIVQLNRLSAIELYHISEIIIPFAIDQRYRPRKLHNLWGFVCPSNIGFEECWYHKSSVDYSKYQMSIHRVF